MFARSWDLKLINPQTRIGGERAPLGLGLGLDLLLRRWTLLLLDPLRRRQSREQIELLALGWRALPMDIGRAIAAFPEQIARLTVQANLLRARGGQ